VPVLVAWSLHWRRSPDWRWPVVSNELRHQHSRMLKRHTSRAPEDGFLCATCNVAIITHRDCDLNSSVAIPTAVAWGPRLEPLHPIVERLAAMLVPIAPYGLVGEVAGLGPLLGAIDEVVSVHATVGGDVSESLLDDPATFGLGERSMCREIRSSSHAWLSSERHRTQMRRATAS
jgi:hypothetical protein